MKRLLKSFISETSLLWLAFHHVKAFLAACRYGFPARKLTVVGVTGTDGKTTTVGMVCHILNASGKKCGSLSTAFIQIGDVVTWNPTQKTSPSPFVVQKFLRECVRSGCTHAVLESSSHGLLQGRLNFTWPMVAGITNLSEEHLDYHGTMKAYLKAKSLLFKKLRATSCVSVLNADDRSFETLMKIKPRWTITYSTKKTLETPVDEYSCGLWVTDIKNENDLLACSLHSNIDSEVHSLHIPMNGIFNINNALCAIGCTYGMNVMLSDAVRALRSFKGIPGRMERVSGSHEFSVFIDFTVTPQSYESTLSTLRPTLASGARLLVLTGSCGDRMKEKRPLVGNIVSRYADVMVVTNEDPYTEDPEKIIDEVWEGIDHTKTKAHRIFDRRRAIRFLLEQAKKSDIVLLCGKGSDTTMWTKLGQIPWNEREIVQEELRSLDTSSKNKS